MRFPIAGAKFHPFACALYCILVISQVALVPAQSIQPQEEVASVPDALSRRLDLIWNREALPARAFVGIAVVDLKTGGTIFARNDSMLFTPASNTKLYSTALALTRLGPTHHMATEVFADGRLNEETGVLLGDLVLRGEGDPSLGSRRFPYSKETEDLRDYPLPALEELADQVAARGVRRIAGNVVGDDSAYVWEASRVGWAQDDALYDFGAPVSALTVNDNAIEFTITPGDKPGAPVTIATRPEVLYYDVFNEVKTTNARAEPIEWVRAPDRQLLMRGAMPAGGSPRRVHVAIDDPALYAACYFRDALVRRGINVAGIGVARHRWAEEGAEEKGLPESSKPPLSGNNLPLASRRSPPLEEILTETNKESMNLFAEMLLCEVARARSGVGSREGGLTELRRFLKELSIPAEGVALFDASGLARLNLVSPKATVQLLQAMWLGPHRDVWVASLPVGGEDGTLERRFGSSPVGASIHAKTGTLRGVSALSGYAITPTGRALAFSAMVNNHPGSSRAAREFLDRMALGIAEEN